MNRKLKKGHLVYDVGNTKRPHILGTIQLIRQTGNPGLLKEQALVHWQDGRHYWTFTNSLRWTTPLIALAMQAGEELECDDPDSSM